ncbi:type III-B CRISPR module-associated protein Cmr5 [Paenibacillus aceti]|uniref:CRISPR type III-B/RAMP module-associated protein Cmr5 n=1 Tax=Paenibacillus aceti TaxID=1820010 RepID=A0ABQ1WAU8_9BACL|nr:type III-B CRISPR module-associated protein Cmr5 [Paenibacillus aceti]GGG19974.1 hypothetical protein GCM10010913_47690 [Paenibacillus aceti]
MKSQDHYYAQTAYNCIKRIENAHVQSKANAQEYGRLCHRFPAMVMLNGLRLTVAYFESVNKGEMHQNYIADLGSVLGIQNWNEELPEQSSQYRHLTRRALQASVWFKRYAEAILKVEGGEADDDNEQTRDLDD